MITAQDAPQHQHNSFTQHPARVALVALNAHFAHTSLAIRLLREHAVASGFPRENIILCEWTINDLPQQLLQRLFAVDADVYAFSCYIWNRRLTERLSDELRKIRPDALIIWGGPEASQDAEAILTQYSAVDAIVAGEGEAAFSELLQMLLQQLPLRTAQQAQQAHSNPSPIPAFSTVPAFPAIPAFPTVPAIQALPNLIYRDLSGEIQHNPMAPLLAAKDWPFPYTDDELITLKDRLLYFETSRGCPYGCTYCLSSLDRSVRLMPPEQVFTTFNRLIEAGLRQIKLVDRTFNILPQRANTIWRWLIDRQQAAIARGQTFPTNFHFEIMADRLDPDALELLAQAPEGLIQFEIGVQTTTPEVLQAIHRPCNWSVLAANVKQLRANTPIHLHLDLIAGLPGETISQFARSFDDVFSLNPHQLQLGFLKVLPGSLMAEQARTLKFNWSNEPPYEILSSDQMNYADLARLKDIESVLELYHNSGRFDFSLAALIKKAPSPFEFFSELAQVNRTAGWFELKASPAARAAFLHEFARQKLQTADWADFNSRLKLDYLLQGAKDQPAFLDLLESSTDAARLEKKLQGRAIIHRDYPRQSRFRLEDFHFSKPLAIDPTRLNRHPAWSAESLSQLPAGNLLCGFDIQANPIRLLFAHSE